MHTHTHTQYGAVRRQSHPVMNTQTLMADIADTLANYGPIFFPFGDRQTRQLFLPRHKSSGCFHTLSTGTAPFIKGNLFRAKQGDEAAEGQGAG